MEKKCPWPDRICRPKKKWLFFKEGGCPYHNYEFHDDRSDPLGLPFKEDACSLGAMQKLDPVTGKTSWDLRSCYKMKKAAPILPTGGSTPTPPPTQKVKCR